MYTLYSMQGSGNCYKLRLALHQTGTQFRLHDIDVVKGETRSAEFLAKNPNGKVPLLELPDGRLLPESNAGLFHLAQGTPLWPNDPFAQAQVLQWMFFEQYSHETNIAVARYWWSIAPGGREAKKNRFDEWHERGYQALDVMEQHLAAHPFFVAGRYSIADISLYAYTHVAHQGAFSLDAYPHIRAWLDRVRTQPGHVAMDWRPAA